MNKKFHKKAFLFNGWEEIRRNIPEGKYRLVFLDFWDHTAEVVGDYDSIEEAEEEILPVGEYEDFVIYNDLGEVVYDLRNFPRVSEGGHNGINLVIGGENVSLTIGMDDKFVVVIVFFNFEGKFEDLLYETAKDIDEARKIGLQYHEKYDDYGKIMILDRDGNIVEEIRGE